MEYIYKHNKSLTSYSRQNRKKQTDAEKLLWRHLRNKHLLGFKFRRQFPINNYILDFYCNDKKIAIELDGSHHSKNKSYDQNRTLELQKQGINVLRFWNNDVLQNIEGVLMRIEKKLKFDYRL